MTESCFIGANYEARTSALYESYSKWCDKAGEKPLAMRAFSQKLREPRRRVTYGKVAGQRGFHGLAIKSAGPGGG